jgi:hypothetical protein
LGFVKKEVMRILLRQTGHELPPYSLEVQQVCCNRTQKLIRKAGTTDFDLGVNDINVIEVISGQGEEKGNDTFLQLHIQCYTGVKRN